MSKETRSVVMLALVALTAVFLCSLVSLGAFVAGRNSLALGESGRNDTVVGLELLHAKSDALSTQSAEIIDAATVSPQDTAPSIEETAVISEDMDVEASLAPVGSNPVELQDDDLDLVIEVWDIIDAEFDGQKPTADEVTYGAIRGSLEMLDDQYTRFIPPEFARLSREQLDGVFEGIGAFVDLNEEGYLVIVRPIKGHPAESAGLQSNDVITHVDGQVTLGRSLDEIIAMVKGPIGTVVTLTVERESVAEPFDISIQRDRIEIPVVESEMLEHGIAYARLTSFNSNATRRLTEAVDALLAQQPRALILDLRDNPGGFLDQSVAVADLFLPDGVVLYQRDQKGEEKVFTSDNGDAAELIPLVVLINEGSASASEIVAGAISDRDRGILIGEATFGKGSVQQTHTLSNGSELRVTIARWYTPNDESIGEQGILPDIEIVMATNGDESSDTQLQRAIDYVLDGR